MTRRDIPAGLADSDLAESACRGDRQAFGELVCRHREGVVRFLVRMVGDPPLAEDAAQEAFLRAWQRLNTYNPQRPFRNWIFSIAAHLALDILRRELKISDLESAELVDRGPGPESQVEMQERQSAIRRAVLTLPPAARAVLVLREYEGLSYGEIASTLSIPVGTVMSRLNYARTRLKAALAPYLERL